jgi:predicted O-methyltransferase YrrM
MSEIPVTENTTTTLPASVTDYIARSLPTLHGWCTAQKAALLASSVLANRPTLAVEIGVFAGRSMFAVALAQVANGHGVSVGIEPWTPEACAQGCEKEDANRTWWEKIDHNLIEREFFRVRRDLGLEGVAQLCRNTAAGALPLFEMLAALHGRPPIDFLHIDGNHSEECSIYDVEHYVPLVAPGGQVWMDDIDWSTTKPAQRKLDELCQIVASYGTYAHYRRH